jgi:hypothetical protein
MAEDLIEKLKAAEKLFHQAEQLCYKSGSTNENTSWLQDKTYNKDGLQINLQVYPKKMYDAVLSVSYNKNIVFKADWTPNLSANSNELKFKMGVTVYQPGEWESKLEELAKK